MNFSKIIQESKEEIKRMESKKPTSYLTIPGIERTPYFSPDQFIRVFCLMLDIKMDELFKGSRERDVMDATHIIRYQLRKVYGMILKDVAEKTGCDEHGTVLNSCKQVESLRYTNNEFRRKFEISERVLRENGLFNLKNK